MECGGLKELGFSNAHEVAHGKRSWICFYNLGGNLRGSVELELSDTFRFAHDHVKC